MNAYSYIFRMRQSGNRLLHFLFRLAVRALEFPFRYLSSYSFHHNSLSHATLKVSPQAYCYNDGEPERVRVGKHCVINGVLRAEWKGRICIGDSSYVGDNCLLWAMKGIWIGNRVLIAHNVCILDNNSHPVDSRERARDYKVIRTSQRSDAMFERIKCRKVVIEDDAWIGFNSIILPGVRIGTKAIIGAGSVVASDIPAGAVAAGNPARIRRRGGT